MWDEENRLLALSDNGFVSNYWYDAAGDRTVKESSNGEGVQVNGMLSGVRTGMTNFTAYISPYLVLNNGGYYTKHIYLGSQRIVSKLGSSDIFSASFSASPLTAVKAYSKDFTAKYADLTGKIKTRYDSLGVTYRGIDNAGAGMITSTAGRIPTPLQYFYHSDHLGSSSLITNASGTLVQHLEYIPFGEVFIDERPSASSWSTPYKFNAKELDEETGLYYYGARYYDPRTSVWISVDPMAEKYPGVSSYVYCVDNPINLVDPDGKSWDNNQWSKIKWWSWMRANSGYTHEHFFSNESYKNAANAVNTMYKNNPQFKSAWNDVKSSNSIYVMDEVVNDQQSGEAGSQQGTNIKLGQNDMNSSTIFEEVYHAAQREFYNINKSGVSPSKAIGMELEAKIAKMYSNIEDELGKTAIMDEYFNALKSGNPISSKLRTEVNNQLKSYAEKLVKPQRDGGIGYEKLKSGLKSFNPNETLKYFESNIKKENK